jgi:hypothetical protein
MVLLIDLTKINQLIDKIFSQLSKITTLFETLVEIDQKREKSLIDCSNLITECNVSIGGKIISSLESYHGPLKIPTNVDI